MTLLLRDLLQTVYGKLVSGAFQATNYQVRFKPDDLSHAHRELRHLPGSFFSMPNGAITRMVPMDNRNRETGKTEYSVDFLCKDFRRLQFVFESKASLEQVTRVIGKFAFPGTQEFMFAYQHSSELKAGHFDGWTLYDIEKDLTRQVRSGRHPSVVAAPHHVSFAGCVHFQTCRRQADLAYGGREQRFRVLSNLSQRHVCANVIV